jgi:transposase
MAKPLVSDELWEVVQPLIPKHRCARNKGGRPPLDDRDVLAGILFVLKTGIPWEYLPQEMGCGSGMSCWRKLRDWHRAGVWKNLHQILLDQLRHADGIDWSRGLVDSSSVRAVHGGKKREKALWTAEKWVPNTTFSPMATERPCRRHSREPTVTM